MGLFETKKSTGEKVLRNARFLSDAEKEPAIYVLDFGVCIKVGRADDLRLRLSHYAAPHCRTVINYKYYYCQDVRAYERFLLYHLKSRPHDGEYIYDTPLEEVLKIADEVMSTKISVLLKLAQQVDSKHLWQWVR